MQFVALIYIDHGLLDAVPQEEADEMMRNCIAHADHLREDGRLLHSRMLAEAPTAKSLRIRDGRMAVVDGPFTETKEMLGGFNLIEAADMDEAVRIASSFPWARTGCVEVRAVQDFDAVRQRVGAPPEPAAAAA
jgi:hypothetical protein